jgi:undecaprenyl-diphosphatase
MRAWLESGRAVGAATDLRCARALHRGASRRPRLQRACWWCSRAGDAASWLLALALLAAFDTQVAGLAVALGAANLLLYWLFKHATRRARPCTRWCDIVAGERAADRYSFPSGHAMHAASFAVLLSVWWPTLAPLLIAFACIVAASRVMLGVHYPSDVIAGAGLGALTAALAARTLA